MKEISKTDLNYLRNIAHSILIEIDKALYSDNNKTGKIDTFYLKEKLNKIENIIK